MLSHAVLDTFILPFGAAQNFHIVQNSDEIDSFGFQPTELSTKHQTVIHRRELDEQQIAFFKMGCLPFPLM